jgi:hypothetical protein
MRFIIDVTSRHAEQIQKHLANGTYESLSQFLSAAIENQLILENSEVSEFKTIATKVNSVAEKSLTNNMPATGFGKYKIENLPADVAIVEAPNYKDLVFASQKTIPEDKTWIWGQINKIFPVKLGLRILHENLQQQQQIPLNDFLELAANEASQLGEIIRSYEEKNNKARDEKISAGLPSKDDSSKARYKFQFIAYQRKDDLLDGAMALMRFCNVIKKNGKLMIGITTEGLRFSNIENPVIDNGRFDISLSEEEASFYINHAKYNIKGEHHAIKWLLTKINNGSTERETLNSDLHRSYGKIWGDATDAVINTQRAGLTARMFELNLLEKQKSGIYVSYGLTRFGKKLLLEH